MYLLTIHPNFIDMYPLQNGKTATAIFPAHTICQVVAIG